LSLKDTPQQNQSLTPQAQILLQHIGFPEGMVVHPSSPAELCLLRPPQRSFLKTLIVSMRFHALNSYILRKALGLLPAPVQRDLHWQSPIYAEKKFRIATDLI
jgi:hypothetical protein